MKITMTKDVQSLREVIDAEYQGDTSLVGIYEQSRSVPRGNSITYVTEITVTVYVWSTDTIIRFQTEDMTAQEVKDYLELHGCCTTDQLWTEELVNQLREPGEPQ